MDDLFSVDDSGKEFEPLASRMRPVILEDYIGQEHLLGSNGPLFKMAQKGIVRSMILWGPPGTGKTTLAGIIANKADAHVDNVSAVSSGVKEIRDVVTKAQSRWSNFKKKTVMILDEIHALSKNQQDVLLPYLENNTITLIGCTTENPSFALNNALMSRSRTYVLKSLSDENIESLLLKAIRDKDNGLGLAGLRLEAGVIDLMIRASGGDARTALNILEMASDFAEDNGSGFYVITKNILGNVDPHIMYDNNGDLHFELLSALHKSVRGSNPDGAIYWCARLLESGCSPEIVARRLTAIASEDIGNADPGALTMAISAWDAYKRMGLAEGGRAIAHLAVYLACAPKSNSVYLAWGKAKSIVKETGGLNVPMHLRNAPTSLMKEQGYSQNYRYAHNEEFAYAAGETYLPSEIKDSIFYEPTERGREQSIKKRMEWYAMLDKNFISK